MTLNVEALLREALTPVEPPVRLAEQLESTLTVLTEAAQEELDGWELVAMRDPRNWVRPVVAASVKPFWILNRPRMTTAAPAKVRKWRWKPPVRKLDMADSDSSAGNVPSANASIVSAPTAKLPFAST